MTHKTLYKETISLQQLVCILFVILTFCALIQVNSSTLVGQVDVPGTTGSMVKYPGQESLYTNVGLTSTADVATSVRGDTWCPMALA